MEKDAQGEREGVEINSVCVDRLSGKVFEVLCPVSDMESAEMSGCVCACCASCCA